MGTNSGASSGYRFRQSDAAFDRWLRDGLRRDYAAVEHEPVPDCLIDLLGAVPRREADRPVRCGPIPA